MGTEARGKLRRSRFRWLALGCLLLPTLAALAAPPKTTQFRVRTIRRLPTGQATVTAQVWADSQRARADLRLPGEEARLLLRDGWVYELNPQRKTGQRFRLPNAAREGTAVERLGQLLGFEPRRSLRAMRKREAERIGDHLCDVYHHTVTRRRVRRRLTVWMPRNFPLPLPLRVERQTEIPSTGGLVAEQVTIYVTDVRFNAALPAGVFDLPRNYRITEGRRARFLRNLQ